MAKSITVYLREEDAGVKQMLKDLRNAASAGNPYVGRSESEISGMLLVAAIREQHKRYCG